MDKNVDNIIKQLSNIEATAVLIMNATDNRKKELFQEMNEITADFDSKLEEDTKKRLEQVREKFNEQKALELSKLRADTAKEIGILNTKYEEKHKELSKDIFEQIIKV